MVHTREPVREPVPPNVWVSPEPVRLRPVLAEKPIVVCQGLNLVSAALVAGARVLSLPMQQEQLMLGYRLAAQDLGLVVPYPADAGMIAGLMRRLAADGRIGETNRRVRRVPSRVRPGDGGPCDRPRYNGCDFERMTGAKGSRFE